MSRLLDQAFDLLHSASKLEEELEFLQRKNLDKERRERCKVAASTKYHEACNLMKLHIKENENESITERRHPENGFSLTSQSKSKRLLLEKISHYEERASNLINDNDNNGELMRAEDIVPLPPPPLESPSRPTHYAPRTQTRPSNEIVDTPRAEIDIPLTSRIAHWRRSESRKMNFCDSSSKRNLSSSSSSLSLSSSKIPPVVQIAEHEADLHLSKAMDLDEGRDDDNVNGRGKNEEALKEYLTAAENYFAAVQRCGDNDVSKNCSKKNIVGAEVDADDCGVVKSRLMRKLEGTIERLEQIKKRSVSDKRDIDSNV